MITFEKPSKSGSHTCVFNCSKLNYYACTPSSRFQIKSEALHYHNYAFIKIFCLYKLLEHNKEQRKASVARFFNAVQKKCVLANLAAVAGLLVLNTGFLLNLDRMHPAAWPSCFLGLLSRGLKSGIELQRWYLALAGHTATGSRRCKPKRVTNVFHRLHVWNPCHIM